VASVPKFFHDAVIFYRSRFFLFLDSVEQGRFEALLRDLADLPLGDATLAVLAGAVRDAAGTVVRWTPGYQVFPLSPALAGYFHAAQYANQVTAAFDGHRFAVDREAVWRARSMLTHRGV